MQRGIPFWMLVLPLAMGCRLEQAEPVAPPPAQDKVASQFDPMATGTIAGRVTWRGAKPTAPAFKVHSYLDYANRERLQGEFANPHAPKLVADGGVGQIVIKLREVDPEKAKPWHHPLAKVRIEKDQLEITQGEAKGIFGFVRAGADVECSSAADDYQTLRARGSAFFTLPFALKDRPTRRRLNQTGIVELSTGAGHYWRRAYLFVLDHPYAALSASDGRFTLEQVPAGTYELTAWMPNWHVVSKEHDPETAIISRIAFGAAVEKVETVTVGPGQSVAMNFTVSGEDFIPKQAVR